MGIIRRIIDFVMDILETITFVGSLFIVIYLFILQPHQVQGASMDNTFASGEYILTSKISYKIDKPKHGDVVVFHSLRNSDIDFIKRIIGQYGDTIRIDKGVVYLNNKALKETYTSSKTNVYQNSFIKEGVDVIVPKDYFFVMGDNREHSSDSREFGFIPRSAIIGKVFFRYFPPAKAGIIKNPFEQN